MEPKLSRRMLSQARVIARGRKIRDVDRLVRTYGGTASRWVKKSSPPFVHRGAKYEYHWYEHHGIGRFEAKRKQVSDR